MTAGRVGVDANLGRVRAKAERHVRLVAEGRRLDDGVRAWARDEATVAVGAEAGGAVADRNLRRVGLAVDHQAADAVDARLRVGDVRLREFFDNEVMTVPRLMSIRPKGRLDEMLRYIQAKGG